LNLNNARFETTAVKPEQYPQSNLPEIAFAGRSNVGKSSMINFLLNRKNLAYVGATPGKTREINFFNIDDKLYFVDLPGYGYAKVPKEKSLSWDETINTYLNVRAQLKLIIMLVDIRHTPTKDDILMHEWLAGGNRPYIVAAAKSDKVTRSQIKQRLAEIRQVLKIPDNIPVIPFSSENKLGKEELWRAINSVLEMQA